MAFDRAADFHAAACSILDADNPGVTPGEKAVICALLAQNEILMGIAEILAAANPNEEAGEDVKNEFNAGKDSMASASILLLQRLQRGG